MSFASKIKKWGRAIPATFATEAPEKPENRPTVATIATIARGPTLESEHQALPSVATVANVARGPTLENEVIEVHNPKLRRRLEVNGLCPDDALALAVKLQARKIDFDDRRICHECRHFTRKLCTNAQAAELSAKMKVFPVPVDMSTALQRCPGFSEAEL
jgi:hypothetical protein